MAASSAVKSVDKSDSARPIRRPLARRSRSKSRRGTFPNPIGLLPLAVGLAIWQMIGNPDSPYLPPPSTWVSAVADLWDSGQLQPGLRATAEAFFISLAIASVLGSVIGMMIGRSRLAFRTTGPLFEFCRAMPAAAVVPLAVIFGGYTSRMEVAVVVFAAVWPILLTVQKGAQLLPATRVELAASLRLRRRETIMKILVPSMVPWISLGIRIAAPIVLIVVLLVEILTQITGLGGTLASAQHNFASAEVYGVLAIACILGFLTNILVAVVDMMLGRFHHG